MPRRITPLRDRVLSRLIIDQDTDCLLWPGGKTVGGYGVVGRGRAGEGGALVHRLMYEWFVGPIPDGFHIDHLCRVRHCATPAHLEAVTCRENILRGVSIVAVNAAKTRCDYGHEFTEANTIVRKSGLRNCRACVNRLWREAYHAGRLARTRSKVTETSS